jgi:hypothetical protein
MKEICYYEADDGKRFDDRWDCIAYERQKQLEECKDEFVFLNYRKEKLTLKNATTENVVYIIIKTERAARVIGDWFDDDGCIDPFDGIYEECVGTWVYSGVLNEGSDEWLKLELEIEQLKTLLEELNRER